MLEITNRITVGQLTIEEAEKFNEFLKRQRYLIDDAERKKRDEIKREEREKYWESLAKKEM